MFKRHSIGVGVLFNPSLADFVEHCSDAVDFYSVIPERFWNDHGRGASGFRHADDGANVSRVLHVAEDHCQGRRTGVWREIECRSRGEGDDIASR